MPYKRKSATAKKHMKRHSAKKHMRPHSAKKHMKKHMKQQKGGKLNEFFKLMLNAKKEDLKSFKYKDNTYNQFTTKTGLKTYKKA